MAFWLLWIATALGGTVTLAEALELALQAHPQAEIADAQLQRARSAQASARSALLPAVVVSGTYTRRPEEVTRQLGDAEAVIQAQDALRGQASVDLPLLDPGALASFWAARTGVRSQAQDSKALRWELGYRVADVYLLTLAQERVVQAADRRSGRATELLEAARARLEAGLGTQNDVTRTELERATAELEAVRARGEWATRRTVLASLLGLDQVQALKAPAMAEPIEERRPSPRQLALELQAREARQQAASAVLGYLPVIGLFGSVSATNETGFTDRHVDSAAGAQATWTLFDGGGRLAAASGQRASAREADALAAETNRQLEEDRQTARVGLESAQAALEVSELRVQVARRNLEELHDRFEAGLATALEVSDAAVGAFEAQAELASQQAEVHRWTLRWAEANGWAPWEVVQ